MDFSKVALISFRRQSRLAGGLEPGEDRELFADGFDMERHPKPEPGSYQACFLITRR